ncbi:MAG: hypothetical protein K2I70_02460, partial [Bacilli bacterium]|nr:hypothetical protein [Bacilli bacterium]
FLPFENITNLFGESPDKDFQQEMVNPDNEQKGNDEVQPTPTPEEPVSSEPEEPLTPEDEGYYFDEEDDDLDEEETLIKDDALEEEDRLPTISNDDFADLVIPNINAYKGRGNSIVDALNYCGYPSNKAYRARLAAFFGIKDYRYLAHQNLQLLEYLYQYYAHLDNSQETNPDNNQNVNPGNGTDNSNADNENNNDNNNDNKNDNENNQDEQHVCSFGDWIDNGINEVRKCSCGKYEERNHSLGPWIDLGNGKEARFCRTCNHYEERTKEQEDEKHTCTFGEWTSYNDDKERRTCSCGKYEERDHKYGPWLDLGNGKEARICSNCGHVHERNKQEVNECDHTLGEWKDNGDGTCSRECACGDKKETLNHVEGELVSTEYIVENDVCIELATYKCANCKTTFVKKTNHGKVIRISVEGDDKNHNLVCETDGRLIGSEPHSLGEPTVTYVDNGDGTHTKTTTYTCTSCNKTITIVKTIVHSVGDLIPIDENYHKRVCSDCTGEIDNKLPHDYTEHEPIDDNHVKHSCACGHSYIETLEHHTHLWGETYTDSTPGDGYCSREIRRCQDPTCSEIDVVSTTPHNFENGECTECWTPDPNATQNDFDYEIDDEDDYDYQVAEGDDFDLKDEDIPETAYLNLSKADIEYMADMAIARMELADALNEEMQAKGLTLSYKG